MVSVMDSLSLLEYAQAKEELCKNEHNNCSKCAGEIKAARIVPEEKIVPFPVLWRRAFTGNNYDSEKARRRILQLPLLSITWNSQVYIAENNTINAFDNFREQVMLKFPQVKRDSQFMSREDFDDVLGAANSEPEKCLVKHSVCSVYNLSKREASKLYGISTLKERASRVSEASRKIADIKSKHAYLARTCRTKSLFANIAFKECVSTRMHCALKQLRRPFFWQSNCRDTYSECNPANLLSILAAIRLFYIVL